MSVDDKALCVSYKDAVDRELEPDTDDDVTETGGGTADRLESGDSANDHADGGGGGGAESVQGSLTATDLNTARKKEAAAKSKLEELTAESGASVAKGQLLAATSRYSPYPVIGSLAPLCGGGGGDGNGATPPSSCCSDEASWAPLAARWTAEAALLDAAAQLGRFEALLVALVTLAEARTHAALRAEFRTFLRQHLGWQGDDAGVALAIVDEGVGGEGSSELLKAFAEVRREEGGGRYKHEHRRLK